MGDVEELIGPTRSLKSCNEQIECLVLWIEGNINYRLKEFPIPLTKRGTMPCP
jgi:hypothetical protein